MFWTVIAVLLIVTIPMLAASVVCTAFGCTRKTHDRVLERVATVIAVIAVIYATVVMYSVFYL